MPNIAQNIWHSELYTYTFIHDVLLHPLSLRNFFFCYKMLDILHTFSHQNHISQELRMVMYFNVVNEYILKWKHYVHVEFMWNYEELIEYEIENIKYLNIKISFLRRNCYFFSISLTYFYFTPHLYLHRILYWILL